MSEPIEGHQSPETVAWPWRQRAAAEAPSAAPIRTRATLQTVVAWAIAGVLYAFGHGLAAALVGVISSLAWVVALISPQGAWAILGSAMAGLARAVASALGWLMLIPLFYLFFLPFGLLFRRGSKDPMRRNLDKGAASYWIERQPVSDRITARKRMF